MRGLTIKPQQLFRQLLWRLIFPLCTALDKHIISSETWAADHLKFQNVGHKPLTSALLSLTPHRIKMKDKKTVKTEINMSYLWITSIDQTAQDAQDLTDSTMKTKKKTFSC